MSFSIHHIQASSRSPGSFHLARCSSLCLCDALSNPNLLTFVIHQILHHSSKPFSENPFIRQPSPGPIVGVCSLFPQCFLSQPSHLGLGFVLPLITALHFDSFGLFWIPETGFAPLVPGLLHAAAFLQVCLYGHLWLRGQWE